MSYGGGEEQSGSPFVVMLLILAGLALGGVGLLFALYTKANVPPAPVVVAQPPPVVVPEPPAVVPPQPAP